MNKRKDEVAMLRLERDAWREVAYRLGLDKYRDEFNAKSMADSCVSNAAVRVMGMEWTKAHRPTEGRADGILTCMMMRCHTPARAAYEAAEAASGHAV